MQLVSTALLVLLHWLVESSKYKNDVLSASRCFLSLRKSNPGKWCGAAQQSFHPGGGLIGFADVYIWITFPLQLGAWPMLAPSMKVKLTGRSLKLKAPQFFRGAKPARSNLKHVTKSTVNQLPRVFRLLGG